MSIPSIHVLGSRQFGGADQFYVRLVRALQADGHSPVAVHRHDSPVAKELAGDSMERIFFPLANGWDVFSAWKIRQLATARAPCIVQTYMGRATRLTRLSPRSGAVHVARLGGYYKIDGYYRHAHAWVGNTAGICDYLIRGGLPASRVFQIGNFVPEPVALPESDRQRLRDELKIPATARILLALGRLIHKKGFADLLHALRRLPRELDGAPYILLILGDGPLRDELRVLSAQLKVDTRVRWLGWKTPPDPYYALADLFVCPSREEPLGNVILEAWNYALPVVSTATAGARELATDGLDALLCRAGDPDGLASAVAAAFSQPVAERVALGQAGRRLLAERYSRKAIVEAYIDLYGRLLAERGHA